MKNKVFPVRFFILTIFILFLSGCHPRPRDTLDACKIFSEHFSWYRYHNRVERKYGFPIWLQLAIISEESGFRHNVSAPYGHRNGTYKRLSTAYGYAQALNNTWKEYHQNNPSWIRSRSFYDDSTDFLGWYLNKCAVGAKIKKNDAYNLYLCYHGGVTGYLRGDYKKKKAIREYARGVEKMAIRYYKQLELCENKLRIEHMYYL